MKNILDETVEKVKVNKNKIIKVGVSIVVIAIIGTGIFGGAVYSYAKSNIKYDKSAAELIALQKVPGDIIRSQKELNFEDATFEYKFEIKDKDNMLKELTVSSKSGAITDIETPNQERYDD